jgi:hypothetical protein
MRLPCLLVLAFGVFINSAEAKPMCDELKARVEKLKNKAEVKKLLGLPSDAIGSDIIYRNACNHEDTLQPVLFFVRLHPDGTIKRVSY